MEGDDEVRIDEYRVGRLLQPDRCGSLLPGWNERVSASLSNTGWMNVCKRVDGTFSGMSATRKVKGKSATS